ncbi:MAG TPA: hypothetical protein VNH11_27995 [Pirellulales bacterium]|nr:hypothetical protein [Pirellulales bacterium]
MPLPRTDVQPPIRVGDKIIQVGPLDWSGFKALVEAFAKADLLLPSLNDGLRTKLAEVQTAARATGTLSLVDLAGLVYEFVAGNLPTLYQWLLKHPPLVTALVRGASNLTDDEIASLSPGEVLRVARAAYSALVADGVFAEAAGFFGELVGMRPPGPAASGASSALLDVADYASESKSASPPPPVGA